MNVVSALIWIVTAWRNVQTLTINNCFLKMNLILKVLIVTLKMIFIFLPFDISSYERIDRDLFTENSDMSVHECVREFQSKRNVNNRSDSESEEDTISSDIKHINEVHNKLKGIQNYFFISGNSILGKMVSDVVSKVETQIVKSKLANLNQTIDDFFQ